MSEGIQNLGHNDADFHRRLQENPHEATAAAVYADWLDEQGRSGEAEVVRGHAAQHRTAAAVGPRPQNPEVQEVDGARIGPEGGHLDDLAAPEIYPTAEVRRRFDRQQNKWVSHVILNSLNHADPESVFGWAVQTENPYQLLHKLREEGVHVPQLHPSRYSAYHTSNPVVVGGVAYKPGFIPDLEKFPPQPAEYSAPPKPKYTDTKTKRLHPKMSKIMKQLKAKFIQAADLVQG